MSIADRREQEPRLVPPVEPPAGLRVPVLFSLALFLGAGLLFLVQPMVGKMLLPTFGGVPAVWNTCMLFFQTALLAGYAYAHVAPARLGLRRHAAIHLGLVLLGIPALLLLRLPLLAPGRWAPPAGANPIPWLLLLLTVCVGYPFLVLSATAPLVQRWFAATAHRAARDPYFLYAASNAGSLLALLSYPFLLEPWMTLTHQSFLWAGSYLAFAGIMTACARMVQTQTDLSPDAAVPTEAREEIRPVSWLRRLRWVGLAFVPSSLMIGVTSYLSTNITPVPLLWVVPLSLYLVSFIIVFTTPPLVPRRLAAVGLLAAMGLQVYALVFPPDENRVLIALHLTAFFAAAVYCHRELAHDRPAPRQLTEFYLLLSAGGMLGGVFNALVAPQIFSYVFEYPLVILMVGLLDAPLAGRPRPRWVDLLVPPILGFVAASLLVWLHRQHWLSAERGHGWLDSYPYAVAFTAMLGMSYLLARRVSARPLRLTLGIGAVLVYLAVRAANDWPTATCIHVDRNFFGVRRVIVDDEGRFVSLYHGTITHGMQPLGADGLPQRHAVATTYYHRNGPIGDLFREFSGPRAKRRIAITGLGTGSLAAYGQPGQEIVFYEIDPAVVRLAQDPRYFTYLADCRADVCRVVLGDARLRMADAPDHSYGLIILDAFSGDAVPVHLLTREALQMYLQKLEPTGVLAVHVSNRYLDLHPVMQALADDAGLVCRCRWQQNINIPAAERAEGKFGSDWVVLARQESDLGQVARNEHWRRLERWPGVGVWTDDFSNLLRIFRWDEEPGEAVQR